MMGSGFRVSSSRRGPRVDFAITSQNTERERERESKFKKPCQLLFTKSVDQWPQIIVFWHERIVCKVSNCKIRVNVLLTS